MDEQAITPHAMSPWDREIERNIVIPRYDDFHRIPLSTVILKRAAPLVLDLGCNVGTMANHVIERWPHANMVLVDHNPQMVETTQRRFSEKHGDFKYIVDDYLLLNLDWMRWDLVISSLSVHRQVSAEKRALFSRIYDALRPGGAFVLCDLMSEQGIESQQGVDTAWSTYVRNASSTMREAEHMLDRSRYDEIDSVEEQAQWLRDTGFVAVDCPFKILHFAALVARKRTLG